MSPQGYKNIDLESQDPIFNANLGPDKNLIWTKKLRCSHSMNLLESGATNFSIPINFFEKKSCTKFPFPPYRTVRPLFTFLKCLLEWPGKFLIIAPKVLLLCFKIRQKFALGNRPYLFRISVMRLENFLIHRFPHQFYFKANK